MRAFLVLGLACLVLAGCGTTDPVRPREQDPRQEDWSYPSAPGKTAVTLFCTDSIVAVGADFEVKAVLYGAQQVFGAVLEVEFDHARAEVREVVTGPALRRTGNELAVSHIDPAGKATFAVTRRQGDAVPDTTTGVVCKFRCRAIASGRADFKVVRGTFSLTTATGASVPNSSRLRREDTSVLVR